MTNSKIEPGTIVRHASFGVGRVTARDNSGGITVDFRTGDSRQMSASVAANLMVLPHNGLEALIWNGPEKVRSWVNGAPLKLLSATLIDTGNTAKNSVIKEKFEGIILENNVKWLPWWERVRTAADGSIHFKTVKNKRNAITGITLAPGVDIDDVPEEPLPEKPKAIRFPPKKSASKREWKNWFLSETEEPAPGRWPNSKVFSDLGKWSAMEVERTLVRTIQAAREFLASGSTPKKAGTAWLNAMSQVSLTWREFMDPDCSNDLAVQTGELLPRLAKTSEDMDGSALISGALAGQPDQWRIGFMAGIWSSFQDSSETVRDLLRAAHWQLGRRKQAALIEEVAMAALGAVGSAYQIAQLDNLLGVLPDDERIRVMHSLILRSEAGDVSKERVMDYVVESRHAAKSNDQNVRLCLLVLSALLIADGPNQVVDQASTELTNVLASPERDKTSTHALFQKIRVLNEKRLNEVLSCERRKYEDLSKRVRLEKERLHRQAADFSAQMASGREESRLEVRQDMLLALGDILQRAYRPGRSSKDRLQDVIATLPTALQAGGAEALGTVGETVRYDPRLHHSTVVIPRGTQVLLSAPGVVVRGRTLGDRVILKASVIHESEV